MFSRCIRKSLAFLFVLSFSIYAVSPVAGTFHSDPGSDHLCETGKPGVKLYLVHFLLTSLFENGSVDAAAGREEDSDDHCLIKKKRAVLAVKNLRPVVSVSRAGSVPADAGRPENVLVSLADHTLVQLHSLQDLVIPLHSGNAPPAAA